MFIEWSPRYGVGIDAMGEMLPGGWPHLIEHNHAQCLRGRDAICNELGVEPPAPDSMIGSISTIILPIDAAQEFLDAMMRTLDAAGVDE